jgi:hypothetical protein
MSFTDTLALYLSHYLLREYTTFLFWRLADFVHVIPDISHLHRLKPLFLLLPYPRARRHAVKKDWCLYLT